VVAAPVLQVLLATLAGEVGERVAEGARFAGLFASGQPDGAVDLLAVLRGPGTTDILRTRLAGTTSSYPSMTPTVPSAEWYERELHDLYGVWPDGHPRLDPLVLPLAGVSPPRPAPGMPTEPPRPSIDESPLPLHVAGEGVVTIPYGPVRSGVFEAVQYLVETPGEDIPHLRTRVYHKHRGLERAFEGLSPDDGVLLAERVEGVASVAHAVAFSQALEQLAEVAVPRPAALVRALHAELERVANHLDSVARHTEAAGQAVAYARMSLHKERVLALRARLCGHRFGRNVVVPGGVSGPPLLERDEVLSALARLEREVFGDLRVLMETPSFLDRLRGTGTLLPEVASAHGALGPVGRGSGLDQDVRRTHPYGAYPELAWEPAEPLLSGDALARQRVRQEELRSSFRLARQAATELARSGAGPWRVPLHLEDGTSLGWAEAPQGEVLYLVEAEAGRLRRVKPRSASFHNLSFFHHAFRGDILTDFGFIEASFGLSVAGVAG
jgi:formate hydrogenlyase subunit 5